MERRTIYSFNWEIDRFIAYVRLYKDRMTVIDEHTLNLLNDAVLLVDDLVTQCDVVRAQDPRPELDDKNFMLRKSLFCRSCNVPVRVEYPAYIEHIQSDEHNFKLAETEFVSVGDGNNNNIDNMQSSEDGFNNVTQRTKSRTKRSSSSEENQISSTTSPISMPKIEEEQKKAKNSPNTPGPNRPVRSTRIKHEGSQANSTQKVVLSKHERLQQFFQSNVPKVVDAAMNQIDHEKESMIQAKIKHAVDATFAKTKYQSIQCDFIGSRVNGTASNKTALIDICLTFDKYDAQCATDFERLMKMNHAWSNMKKQNTTPAQTKYIIFVVIHVNTQRSCRFVVGSVGSKDFQRNNEMVQKVFGIQEICRTLVVSIRLSMEALDGNLAQKFSGYTVSLLVIFYFQAIGMLPSIKDLKVSYTVFSDVPKYTESLSRILLGFFEFYSNFDFKANIISVFEGHAIERAECGTGLSASVTKFKERMVNEPTVWAKHKMCIQDIFLEYNNVTCSINAPDTQSFSDFCAASEQILNERTTDY